MKPNVPLLNPHPPAPETTSVTGEVVESSMLFKGRDILNIHHHGRIYRLQQTRQGKLILTK